MSQAEPHELQLNKVSSAEPQVSKTNATALFALIASVLGFFCFFGVGGVVGIVLGVSSRSEIQRSEGREHGARLAAAAIALGIVNIATAVVATGIAIAFMVRPDAPTGPAPHAVTLAPPSLSPPRPTTLAVPAPPAPGSVTADRGTREVLLGRVRMVDIHADVAGLRAAISQQAAAAKGANETVLVFVVAPDCAPCNGVALALRTPQMQTALRGVRLLRVSAGDFSTELSEMGVPTATVPGFALLAEGRRVTDYVHGGEWDADIAANIAPVLGAFVRGAYTKRRHPFLSPARPDQTAL